MKKIIAKSPKEFFKKVKSGDLLTFNNLSYEIDTKAIFLRETYERNKYSIGIFVFVLQKYNNKILCIQRFIVHNDNVEYYRILKCSEK